MAPGLKQHCTITHYASSPMQRQLHVMKSSNTWESDRRPRARKLIWGSIQLLYSDNVNNMTQMVTGCL